MGVEREDILATALTLLFPVDAVTFQIRNSTRLISDNSQRSAGGQNTHPSWTEERCVVAAFDVDKFAEQLNQNADKVGFGRGRCAYFVRRALASGGYSPQTWPVHAREWGPWLIRAGFRTVRVEKLSSFRPLKGDVAVIQGTTNRRSGHIQGFDGKNWVSDFVQTNGFWPGSEYRKETPAYVIYRP